MKIGEICRLTNGEVVEFKGLVSDKKISYKKDGNPYIIITLQDNTGSITFPIWDNYDEVSSYVDVNTVIVVKGYVGFFNNQPQIKNPVLKKLEGKINYEDLVPVYEIPKETINYFINTLESLQDKYKKIAIAATGALGYNEERWEAFTSCVAAEKYHGNKRGGLFLHTIGVMKTMESILYNYIDNPFFMSAKEVLNKDRLILKCILHDIMKIKEYEYNGIIKRKGLKLDHLVMAVAYLNEINKEVGEILSEEEVDDICYSILSHHGEYGKFETKGIEDVLLNIADMADSQIVNAVENKI